jgi:SAM-dependent methyltransferase
VEDGEKNRDSFSRVAPLYAAYRPTYPPELYRYLADLAPRRQAALDVATGSGQAAIALADYFESVVAIDSSAEQLSHAKKHPRVMYRRMRAEQLDLEDRSFDLVTVALGLHWLDLDAFWPEVRRVLKPNGVFAAWGYGYFTISPEIDSIVERTVLVPLEPYWATANRTLIDRYGSISFPFEEISAPHFELVVSWDLDQLLGFISTWSALKRYESEAGGEVLDPARDELGRIWPKGERHAVHMPLALRVGRKVLMDADAQSS